MGKVNEVVCYNGPFSCWTLPLPKNIRRETLYPFYLIRWRRPFAKNGPWGKEDKMYLLHPIFLPIITQCQEYHEIVAAAFFTSNIAVSSKTPTKMHTIRSSITHSLLFPGWVQYWDDLIASNRSLQHKYCLNRKSKFSKLICYHYLCIQSKDDTNNR